MPVPRGADRQNDQSNASQDEAAKTAQGAPTLDIRQPAGYPDIRIAAPTITGRRYEPSIAGHSVVGEGLNDRIALNGGELAWPFFYGLGDDWVSGRFADGATVSIPRDSAITRPTRAPNFLMGWEGRDRLEGTPESDRIAGEGLLIEQGSDGTWSLVLPQIAIAQGRTADDVLVGGAGPDVLLGEYGDDQLYAQDEASYGDLIARYRTQQGGGSIGDTLDGGPGDDQIFGGAENDVLLGGGGYDLIFAGGGDDVVLSDQHFEPRHIVSAAGNIAFYDGLGAPNPIQFGTRGHDGLMAPGFVLPTRYRNGPVTATYQGNDWIHGGNGNDIIHAGEGRDRIEGDAGDDTLHGEAGDDLLMGGAGTNFLFGGAGNDRYELTPGANDTIYDVLGENTLALRLNASELTVFARRYGEPGRGESRSLNILLLSANGVQFARLINWLDGAFGTVSFADGLSMDSQTFIARFVRRERAAPTPESDRPQDLQLRADAPGASGRTRSAKTSRSYQGETHPAIQSLPRCKLTGVGQQACDCPICGANEWQLPSAAAQEAWASGQQRHLKPPR